MTPTLPRSYNVSGSSLVESSESEQSILEDPRGLVHIWHPPSPHQRYVMGHDPTHGITGWTRGSRNESDRKTDNGAIEIFSVDAVKRPVLKDGKPDIDPLTRTPRFTYSDLQVAEYFAPIDAVESARVCNLLGRIYAGDADDQCLLIHESRPGPGILTTQELLRLGYGNFWYWEYIDSVVEETQSIGWHSTYQSQQILWSRARRHLMSEAALILSPWLLSEYANAVIDLDRMRARAAYGMHDDLLQAANMAFWAGHRWVYDPERTEEKVSENGPPTDWQRRAPTFGDSMSMRDSWAAAVDDWD